MRGSRAASGSVRALARGEGAGAARLLSFTGVVAAAISASGCLLTNIHSEDCKSDDECATAFGLGSACDDGFCTTAPECASGHDCRSLFGGGACVEGGCANFIPPPPDGACLEFEPPDLLDRPLTGEGSHTVVGAMFRLGNTADPPMAKAAQLGVREIDEVGGLVEGRPLGFVLCDNGGDMNLLEGDARSARITGLLDYLAGTLGVPVIVGPVTSSDSLTAINHLVSQRYPTVLISPSATSPQLTDAPDRLDQGDPHGLFWRTAPSDLFQGLVLARDVVSQFPVPSMTRTDIAILYLDDAYGLGLANAFKDNWDPGPGHTSVLYEFSADPGAVIDWAQVAAQMAAQGPDGILMVSVDAVLTTAFIDAMAGEATIQGLPLYLTDGSKDADRLLNDPNLSAEARAIVQSQVFGTAPANPSGLAFDFFAAALQAAFAIDPRDFSFVANSYDAVFVGAMGIVFASQAGGSYDGRSVAAGMSRLSDTNATLVPIGKNDWNAAKARLTSGGQTIDIVGISGSLDFDGVTGEAPGPIEIWKPANILCSMAMMGVPCCTTQVPCFASVGLPIEP